MTDINQEISEDYYIDDEDNIFNIAFGEDIDRLNSDVKAGNVLEQEITQLNNTAVAVEAHGVNAALFIDAYKAGLLSGTAFSHVGLEVFNKDHLGDAESEMAMESLQDSIKKKMAEWSDKILTFTKSMAEKVTGILSHLWDDITGQVKHLGAVAWDKTKATGAAIKAHPYRTVFAALAAAGAVAAIVAYTASTGSSVYANESALQSFMYKIKDMVDKIHWPFGKPKVEIIQNGTKIVYRMETDGVLGVVSKTPVELGWSQSAVKAIGGQAARVWVLLKSSIGAIGAKIVNAAKFVNNVADPGAAVKDATVAKTGSKIAGWVSQQIANKVVGAALWSVIGVLTKLLTDIGVRSFRETKKTLYKLDPTAQPA